MTTNDLTGTNGIGKVSVHLVQKGECLSGIAKECHVSIETLLELNPEIKNIDRIEINQKIIVSKNIKSEDKKMPEVARDPVNLEDKNTPEVKKDPVTLIDKKVKKPISRARRIFDAAGAVSSEMPEFTQTISNVFGRTLTSAKYKSASKLVGRVGDGLAIAAGGVQIGIIIADKELSKGEKVVESSKVAGKTAGGLIAGKWGSGVGLSAGMKAGAAIGSIFPGAGTAIGAVIGGGIGALGGYIIAGKIGGEASGFLTGKVAEVIVGEKSDD